MELAGLDGLLLRMRAKARIDNFPIEARRVFRGLEHDGMLSDAGRAEIIRNAAHRDDKRIVCKGSFRCDLLALVVKRGRQMNFAVFAVEPDHFAEAKPKIVPVGVREIVDLMLRGIHAAGGDFMKQRLPEMGAGTLDQRNPRLALGRQTVAKARYELQSPGPSAHDDNMVQIALA